MKKMFSDRGLKFTPMRAKKCGPDEAPGYNFLEVKVEKDHMNFGVFLVRERATRSEISAQFDKFRDQDCNDCNFGDDGY